MWKKTLGQKQSSFRLLYSRSINCSSALNAEVKRSCVTSDTRSVKMSQNIRITVIQRPIFFVVVCLLWLIVCLFLPGAGRETKVLPLLPWVCPLYRLGGSKDGRDNRRSTPTERADSSGHYWRVLSPNEGLSGGKAAVVPYPGNLRSDTAHSGVFDRLPSLSARASCFSPAPSPACPNRSRGALLRSCVRRGNLARATLFTGDAPLLELRMEGNSAGIKRIPAVGET